jgi:hypothetical protein
LGPLEKAVLAEFIAPVDGDFPQGDVVVLGAGEVLEGSAVAFRGNHPEVHVKALLEAHRGFGGPLAPDLDHPREGHEKIHHPGRVGGDHQEIHVADGFFHPTDGAGDVGPLHFRQALQLLQDLIGNGQNFPQEKPAFAAF